MYIATRRARLEAREAGFLVLIKDKESLKCQALCDNFSPNRRVELETLTLPNRVCQP